MDGIESISEIVGVTNSRHAAHTMNYLIADKIESVNFNAGKL